MLTNDKIFPAVFRRDLGLLRKEQGDNIHPFIMSCSHKRIATGYANSKIHQQAITSSSAMAERPRELGDFEKALVNGGTGNQSLKDSHKCLRCR